MANNHSTDSSRQENKRRRATDRPAIDTEGRVLIVIAVLLILALATAIFLNL